jgi:hypothetical protein
MSYNWIWSPSTSNILLRMHDRCSSLHFGHMNTARGLDVNSSRWRSSKHISGLSTDNSDKQGTFSNSRRWYKVAPKLQPMNNFSDCWSAESPCKVQFTHAKILDILVSLKILISLWASLLPLLADRRRLLHGSSDNRAPLKRIMVTLFWEQPRDRRLFHEGIVFSFNLL